MHNAIEKCTIVLLAVLGLCHVSNAATVTYQYDALGRLSVVSDDGYVITYVYDAAGNRTHKQSQITASLSLPSSTAVEHRGSVVLKITVAGSSPTGMVSFYEGTTFLGSAPVLNGVAAVELVGLSRGTHTITVSYSGDGSNAPNSVTFPIKVVNLDWLPAVLEILLN
jgi:hypothetical protein